MNHCIMNRFSAFAIETPPVQFCPYDDLNISCECLKSDSRSICEFLMALSSGIPMETSANFLVSWSSGNHKQYELRGVNEIARGVVNYMHDTTEIKPNLTIILQIVLRYRNGSLVL